MGRRIVRRCPPAYCMRPMATTSNAVAPALLTKQQTADYLGLSTRSIERLTSTGIIKSVRVTKGAVRYRRSEIDAYVDSLAYERGDHIQ